MRNISVSKVNGYTVEKVKKAKEYLDEIGQSKRTFPFARLVEMYNDIKGTNESPNGCSCLSPKYYNGIQNYYTYGKITLINTGKAVEADFEEKPVEVQIENVENRIILGEPEVKEEVKEEEVPAVEEVIEEEEKPKKKVKK